MIHQSLEECCGSQVNSMSQSTEMPPLVSTLFQTFINAAAPILVSFCARCMASCYGYMYVYIYKFIAI